MPPITLLIKPASSACNLACRYCFYRDIAEHREVDFQGMLPLGRLEQLVTEAFAYAEGQCSFAFQGGEPTLAGLPFFREAVRLQKQLNQKGLQIHNAIQTNGMALDDEWAAFFAENHFLVGLSLDGPAEIHNANRIDHADKGSWAGVMQAVQLLEKHKVDVNMLCVVTGQNARHIQSIYQFFRKQSADFLQFIPCLEPLDAPRGETAWHLSVPQYAEYLINLFDLWFRDFCAGKYVSIRHIDNWVGMLMGRPPEMCSMAGQCGVNFVVEGDGGVYPCDFYVQDEWRMGTVGEQSFEAMMRSPVVETFYEASLPVPEECKACRWYGICRNGCRRDRIFGPDVIAPHNYYCEAYKAFFDARMPQMQQAARMAASM